MPRLYCRDILCSHRVDCSCCMFQLFCRDILYSCRGHFCCYLHFLSFRNIFQCNKGQLCRLVSLVWCWHLLSDYWFDSVHKMPYWDIL